MKPSPKGIVAVNPPDPTTTRLTERLLQKYKADGIFTPPPPQPILLPHGDSFPRPTHSRNIASDPSTFI